MKVRILADTQVEGVNYKPNQVVDLPNGIAKGLVGSGNADAAPEAVAYCVDELQAEIILHKPAGQGDDAAAQTNASKPAQ